MAPPGRLGKMARLILCVLLVVIAAAQSVDAAHNHNHNHKNEHHQHHPGGHSNRHHHAHHKSAKDEFIEEQMKHEGHEDSFGGRDAPPGVEDVDEDQAPEGNGNEPVSQNSPEDLDKDNEEYDAVPEHHIQPQVPRGPDHPHHHLATAEEEDRMEKEMQSRGPPTAHGRIASAEERTEERHAPTRRTHGRHNGHREHARHHPSGFEHDDQGGDGYEHGDDDGDAGEGGSSSSSSSSVDNTGGGGPAPPPPPPDDAVYSVDRGSVAGAQVSEHPEVTSTPAAANRDTEPELAAPTASGSARPPHQYRRVGYPEQPPPPLPQTFPVGYEVYGRPPPPVPAAAPSPLGPTIILNMGGGFSQQPMGGMGMVAVPRTPAAVAATESQANGPVTAATTVAQVSGAGVQIQGVGGGSTGVEGGVPAPKQEGKRKFKAKGGKGKDSRRLKGRYANSIPTLNTVRTSLVNGDPKNAAVSTTTKKGYRYSDPSWSRQHFSACYVETRLAGKKSAGWSWCKKDGYKMAGMWRNHKKCDTLDCLEKIWCCQVKVDHYQDYSSMESFKQQMKNWEHTIKTGHDSVAEKIRAASKYVDKIQYTIQAHQRAINDQIKVLTKQDVHKAWSLTKFRQQAMTFAKHNAHQLKIVTMHMGLVALVRAVDAQFSNGISQYSRQAERRRLRLLSRFKRYHKYFVRQIANLEAQVHNLHTSADLVANHLLSTDSKADVFIDGFRRLQKKDVKMTKAITDMMESLLTTSNMTESYVSEQNGVKLSMDSLDIKLAQTEKVVNKAVGRVSEIAKSYDGLTELQRGEVLARKQELEGARERIQKMYHDLEDYRHNLNNRLQEASKGFMTNSTLDDGASGVEHDAASHVARRLSLHFEQLKIKMYGEMQKLLHGANVAAEDGSAPGDGGAADAADSMPGWAEQVGSKVIEKVLSRMNVGDMDIKKVTAALAGKISAERTGGGTGPAADAAPAAGVPATPPTAAAPAAAP